VKVDWISSIEDKCFEDEKFLTFTKNLKEKYNLIEDIEEIRNPEKIFFESEKINKLAVISENENFIALVKIYKDLDWSGKRQLSFEVMTILDKEFSKIYKILDIIIDEKSIENVQNTIITFNDEFSDYAQQKNTIIQGNGNHYTLSKSDIDIEKLMSWVKEISSNNSDLRIEFFHGIPEEYIEPYCTLFMETSEDMPDNKESGFVPYVITPDLQRKNHVSYGQFHYCYMIFNEKNELIAKSNVRIKEDYPYQFMIGVKREYRGRKLGKWLHGSMYSKVYKEKDFKKIHIVHHPLNKAAINLSLSVGYKFIFNEKKYIFV